MAMPPELILINPWIYDFAAYDLWSKPLGLLYLASRLRQAGFRIHLVDCLYTPRPAEQDRTPGRSTGKRHYGTGKFPRARTTRPLPLKDIPRPYSRYGISPERFVQELEKSGAPAAVLTTSLMTYWYPGVQEVVRLCRQVHPQAPVILGGSYARLCTGHALRHAGADHVVAGSGTEAVKTVLGILRGYGIPAPLPPEAGGRRPYPALDLYTGLGYAPIVTSTGCPFQCTYCASKFLYPVMERREPGEVLQEILFWHGRYGIVDFAFYDDALLAGAESHAAVFLEEIARRNLPLRFHTPNAIHVREIRRPVARLLRRAGFRTIRLGLETSDPALRRRTGNKLSGGEFERAVKGLHAAGFSRGEIGAYILMGLPGQTVESVRDTVLYAGRVGAMPYLAEYSPIPHTPMWEEALACSEWDLASEPLLHNNTLLPCWDVDRRSGVPGLRELVRRIRAGG